tara:strand:- start:254 stop:1207 length:954 start_codon:yes stop_codon:yes gene_type:complete
MSKWSSYKDAKVLFENFRKFVNEGSTLKPKLIFLIGPPSVGKSRWVQDNMSGDYLVLNRDDIVEKVARESGVGTYDDTYKKPPAEILPTPLPEPQDRQAVEQYLASLKAVADKFNNENPEQTKQFGPVEPFTAENYIKALTPRTEGGWGVPMLTETGEQNFIPLYYPKINTVLGTIRKQFEEERASHARDTKDVVIDMLNMSLDERDGHRMEMANAIAENSAESVKEARQIVNDKFDQVAYVFADGLEGWSDEDKTKVKQSAEIRAAEIAAEPGRSKTIPPQAFDRFFNTYNPPEPAEGFSKMEPVGMPALTPKRGF